MAPYKPLPCSLKSCDYQTPPEANQALMDQIDCIRIHFKAVHPKYSGTASEGSESIRRPEAWEDMWYWQLEGFLVEWEIYKREKSLLDEKKVLDELWECMSKRLCIRVIKEVGFRVPINEAEAIVVLKKISINKAEQRLGNKRARSKSRERRQSNSGSTLEVCGEDGQKVYEGEEKTRLRTRSRCRAVRISLEDMELELAMGTSAD